MKITNQTHPAITDSTSRQKPGGTVENQGFAALLNPEAKTALNAVSAGTPAGAPGLDCQSPALMANWLLAGGQIGGIQAAASGGQLNTLEEALTVLTDYAQALADTRQSLKDIAPLAEALEPLAGRLGQASQEIDDPALKILLDQAAITATVEAMKFKRGDYV